MAKGIREGIQREDSGRRDQGRHAERGFRERIPRGQVLKASSYQQVRTPILCENIWGKTSLRRLRPASRKSRPEGAGTPNPHRGSWDTSLAPCAFSLEMLTFGQPERAGTPNPCTEGAGTLPSHRVLLAWKCLHLATQRELGHQTRAPRELGHFPRIVCF